MLLSGSAVIYIKPLQSDLMFDDKKLSDLPHVRVLLGASSLFSLEPQDAPVLLRYSPMWG